MKTKLIILFLLIFNFSYAQLFPGGSIKLLRDIEDNNKIEGTNENIEGSKYLRPNFVNATIAPFKGKTFSVRYNAVDDNFEVLKGKNNVIILDKYGVNNEITIGSKKYVVVNNGYFVEIYKSDDFVVYKKEFKKYNPKVAPRSSYDKEKKAYYDKNINEAYYLKNKTNNMSEFSLNSRGIKKAFPNHSKEIKSFIKEKNIDLDNQKDLIKLLTYINTL